MKKKVVMIIVSIKYLLMENNSNVKLIGWYLLMLFQLVNFLLSLLTGFARKA